MKNREKFREKIINLTTSGEGGTPAFCEFVKSNVLPNYTNKECDDIWCHTCTMMFAFWLDEEYVEPQKPEVDWSKVPVDTLVMVKDFEGEEWVLRYFKEIDENCEESKYVTWIAGATSKTAYGFTEYWNYCELVEEKEDE